LVLSLIIRIENQIGIFKLMNTQVTLEEWNKDAENSAPPSQE